MDFCKRSQAVIICGGRNAYKTERARRSSEVIVLPVHDEPDRGRWGDSNRIAPGLVPVLWDGSATVVAEHDKPP